MKTSLPDLFKHLVTACCAIVLLSACGGGGGTSVTSVPNTNRTVESDAYSGPAPESYDVQQFKLNVWDNLSADNRCGACHGAGGQSPTFVHDGDINIAYAQVQGVVNLDSPSESTLATKVGGGHNCWLESDSACADTISRYIELWSGGVSGSQTRVVLRAPTERDPGESKVFPEDSGLFSTTVYPLVEEYCSACHVEGIQNPVIGSPDVDVAYAAAQSRIDLQTPANSRLVVRLREESHNCWDGDCAAAATEMEDAITAMADAITAITIDEDLVVSKALTLDDGVVANTGGRYQDNVIALYEFKTGEGTIAYDTSGVEPALNLNLSGTVNWVGGWGIEIRDGKAQGSTTASRKLFDKIAETGEYSIEAWVAPGNVTQEDARIISYSGGTTARNFTLGQTLYNYDFLHRSSTTNANGQEALSTDDDAERLQATLQHVVATFTPGEGRRLFINGVYTEDPDPVSAGNLNEWDNTFAFVLGNEVSNDRLWQGTLRMVAIHNRALTGEQIQQNYDVGVGQKFFLLFGVSHLIDVPQAYIVFEGSQFDSYSYLFNAPYFISLDSEATPGSIALEGMRLGINGKLASVGQAYANLDITLNDSDYSADEGQVVSNLGTIIALENGPTQDEFFLTFERLGDFSNVYVEATAPAPAAPADSDPVSDIGLRTFDEVNASMSAMTGVPRDTASVASTFQTVRQQLPSVETFGGFLSAHQMAVTQLAIQYCDALVEDSTLRSDFFGSFNFNAAPATAFADPTVITDPLLLNMVGTGLDSQPQLVDIETELNTLISRLSACGGSCEPDRTETVVKATCAAVLGSAIMLVQ